MSAAVVDPGGPALTVTEVSKTFPGTKALDAVSFEVQPASFHALVGGNGSGKSTFIKILAGVYQGDSGGFLTIGGDNVQADATTPGWSSRAGIRFVHQDLGLFEPMSVAENLFVSRPYPRRLGGLDWTAMNRSAQHHLRRLGVDVDVRRQMSSLRPAEQTLVAIARCLFDLPDDAGAEAVKLLVLDEPTARLPQAEVNELLERLSSYVRAGQSILYVSHRLDEVLEHAGTVTVLRDGQHVATKAVSGLDRKSLTAMIVGSKRDLATIRADRHIHDATVLEVDNLRGGPLTDVSLRVHRGEIVAVAGLVGSGRTSLLEAIFGVHRPESGSVKLHGAPLRSGRVAEAVAAGIAYLPEDRARDSAFRDLGLDMNLSAANLHTYRRGGWFRHAAEVADAKADIRRFAIRTPGPRAPLAQLSGGNQQKAVVARWLRRRPQLLLLDEPTQGVDVGARAEIYAQIESAVREGAAVLLVSSDLDEVLHLADRVVILAHGRITDSAAHGDLTRDWVATRMFDPEEEIT